MSKGRKAGSVQCLMLFSKADKKRQTLVTWQRQVTCLGPTRTNTNHQLITSNSLIYSLWHSSLHVSIKKKKKKKKRWSWTGTAEIRKAKLLAAGETPKAIMTAWATPGLKAPNHFRIQCDYLISCYGKPGERTNETSVSLGFNDRSTVFPRQLIGSAVSFGSNGPLHSFP